MMKLMINPVLNFKIHNKFVIALYQHIIFCARFLSIINEKFSSYEIIIYFSLG